MSFSGGKKPISRPAELWYAHRKPEVTPSTSPAAAEGRWSALCAQKCPKAAPPPARVAHFA